MQGWAAYQRGEAIKVVELRRSRNLTPELPPWDAVIAAAGTKALRRLPRDEQERILAAIETAARRDVRRLKGRRDEWRLRVGDWRALIRLDGSAHLVVVTAVTPRGRAYDR